jgi:hypothetical protein
MKNLVFRAVFLIVSILLVSTVKVFCQTAQSYILGHDADIAKTEKGTHNGGGNTTGYSFLSKADDLKIAFRKRILHPGSAIGYHLQNQDEIYYIISGTG